MIQSSKERQAPACVNSAEPTHRARYDFATRYVSQEYLVLDAGCGTGYGSAIMASNGAMVVGIDNSQGAIAHANELFCSDSIEFIVGNIENLLNSMPTQESLDLMVCFEAIEHLLHPERFLEGARSLLKPDGRFLVSTPVLTILKNIL